MGSRKYSVISVNYQTNKMNNLVILFALCAVCAAAKIKPTVVKTSLNDHPDDLLAQASAPHGAVHGGDDDAHGKGGKFVSPFYSGSYGQLGVGGLPFFGGLGGYGGGLGLGLGGLGGLGYGGGFGGLGGLGGFGGGLGGFGGGFGGGYGGGFVGGYGGGFGGFGGFP